MEGPSNITRGASTSNAIATTTVFVRSVTLTAGNAVATATVRAGGETGTTLLSLATGSNTSVCAELHDAQFVDGVHVVLSGTGASATVVYS